MILHILIKGSNFNYELVCSLVCRRDIKFKSGEDFVVYTANRMTAVKAVYEVICGCECLYTVYGEGVNICSVADRIRTPLNAPPAERNCVPLMKHVDC